MLDLKHLDVKKIKIFLLDKIRFSLDYFCKILEISSTITEFQNKLLALVEIGYADGAYDKAKCYQTFTKLGIDPVIPPQNAILHEAEPWMQ